MALLIIIDGSPRNVTIAHEPPFTMQELSILTNEPEHELRAFPINHETYKWLVANPVGMDRPMNTKASEIFLQYAADEEKAKLPVGAYFCGDAILCDAIEGKPV